MAQTNFIYFKDSSLFKKKTFGRCQTSLFNFFFGIYFFSVFIYYFSLLATVFISQKFSPCFFTYFLNWMRNLLKKFYFHINRVYTVHHVTILLFYLLFHKNHGLNMFKWASKKRLYFFRLVMQEIVSES